MRNEESRPKQRSPRTAKGVREMLSIKFPQLAFDGAWADAFGQPESRGIWIVWGASGSGKTSFVMQLCKQLCRWGRVVYNSLEEGVSLTMQNTLRRAGMAELPEGRFLLVHESIEQLSARLKRQRAPQFVVIDSFQYTRMSYPEFIAFKEAHRDKLIVFISHAAGTNPDGRTAKKVLYDASLKIYVEGKRAFSHGRFIEPVGHYDVWPEAARKYHGEEALG